MRIRPAPPIVADEWINTPTPISLDALRGRVVLIEAFQMLCPGCVSTALPQAQRVRQLFRADQLAVIGLHSVFEHHAAQGSRAALEAFAHEYRLGFPIAIDKQADTGGVPLTMRAYAMQGTPTLVLIDRQGGLRMQRFGHVDDLLLGQALGALMAEPFPVPANDPSGNGCDDEGCAIPNSARGG